MAQSDAKFVGAIPEIYDRLMVPLMFQQFAEDMAARVAALQPGAVLETAAGTGVVTRALAPQLGPKARYVVSDLNPPMLDRARSLQPADARLEWLTADALNLPFDAGTFDALCCQFGAMFFPDRQKGFGEARRVLKPGAPMIFNLWDVLEENPVILTASEEVTAFFPDNPVDFFRRVPYGYNDDAQIRADLTAAGFHKISIERVARKGEARTAREVAVAIVQGTPIRMEVLARDPQALDAVTDVAEKAVRDRYGAGPIVVPLQALVVTAAG